VRFARAAIQDQRPTEREAGRDKGIDGIARFYLDRKATGRVLVSVKADKNIGPSLVRDLPGTVETQRAQTGVLITMAEPPRGVIDAANHGGACTWPVNGQMFPESR
jgi:NACHT-associated inactive restriction endonuclease